VVVLQGVVLQQKTIVEKENLDSSFFNGKSIVPDRKKVMEITDRLKELGVDLRIIASIRLWATSKERDIIHGLKRGQVKK